MTEVSAISTRYLVERASRRDEDAFAALVRPHLAQMIATASAIIGVESDAGDAVQEALTKAWRGLPGLRDPDRYDAWLARILLNECRDALRRVVRSRLREIYLGPDFGGAGGGVRAPGDLAEDAGAREALGRAFDRLGAGDRIVLVLHHLEDRPIREIAEILGIPEGTAKSRLHAARAALEGALERERR